MCGYDRLSHERRFSDDQRPDLLRERLDAVLDANMAPKMAPLLPPSVNAALKDTKMVPSMRHRLFS